MIFEHGKYYHFYNRSNNHETVFKNNECYCSFLQKYQLKVGPHVSTVAYCLMPTHFHFLIQVTADDRQCLHKGIASLLSSYTKMINLSFNRHGSLFQPRSKAIEIDDERYLITVLSYIHQNPVRARLVDNPTEWEFSSYRDHAGLRKGSFVDRTLVETFFSTHHEFIKYTEELIQFIQYKYWV